MCIWTLAWAFNKEHICLVMSARKTPQKRQWCLCVRCEPHQDSQAFEQRVKNRGQEEEFPELAYVWQRMSDQVEQEACQPCSQQGLPPQTTGWQHMAQQPTASISGTNREGKRVLLSLLPCLCCVRVAPADAQFSILTSMKHFIHSERLKLLL